MQSYDLRLQNASVEDKPIDQNMAFYSQRSNSGRGQGNGRGRGGHGFNNQFNSKGRGSIPAGKPNNNSHHCNYSPRSLGQGPNGGQNYQSAALSFGGQNYQGVAQNFQNTQIRPVGLNQNPNQSFKPNRPECQICGKTGHTAIRCWHRWDFSYQAQEDLPQDLTATSLTDPQDPNIYADMGANAHILNNPSMVSNLVPYHGPDKVMVGDWNKLAISHIGDSSLESSYGVVPLQNVLVVPNIHKNLIYVSQLTKDQSCIFEFSDNGFLIKDRQTGRILATGSRKGNLYALDGNMAAALVAIKSGKAPEDIWHQRLGHPHS